MERFTMSNDRAHSLTSLHDIPYILVSFAKDPIGLMKTPMRLTWPALISIQVGAAMISGALAGMFAKNFFDFLLGMLIFPITSVAIAFIFSGFIYMYFSVFRSTFLDFRSLHSLIVISLVPYFLLHTLSGFLPPMSLIGFALTSILMIVGLVEQFGLHRKTVISMIGILGGIFLVGWIVAQIRMSDTPKHRQGRTPSSLSAPVIEGQTGIQMQAPDFGEDPNL
jgi:hypothetical protein